MGLEDRLARVHERMAAAARRAGRNPGDVTLVAVTKTVPADVVAEAVRLGLTHFGENRVEEAQAKSPQVQQALGGARVTWHMIGHIQSRKADEVVAQFDWVHSVDSLKLARRLSRFAEEAGRTLPVLLEVNVSGEASKYGFPLSGWPDHPEQGEAFLGAVRDILALPALRLEGLMTMAPFASDPEAARPTFRRLREVRDTVAQHYADTALPHLSMGMTDDFEVAIEEGATLVRIGRALFGERPPQ
jgi:pyridoxal phosphate enzyme (YggS family)